jgi:hypothetical protein
MKPLAVTAGSMITPLGEDDAAINALFERRSALSLQPSLWSLRILELQSCLSDRRMQHVTANGSYFLRQRCSEGYWIRLQSTFAKSETVACLCSLPATGICSTIPVATQCLLGYSNIVSVIAIAHYKESERRHRFKGLIARSADAQLRQQVLQLCNPG